MDWRGGKQDSIYESCGAEHATHSHDNTLHTMQEVHHTHRVPCRAATLGAFSACPHVQIKVKRRKNSAKVRQRCVLRQRNRQIRTQRGTTSDIPPPNHFYTPHVATRLFSFPRIGANRNSWKLLRITWREEWTCHGKEPPTAQVPGQCTLPRNV